MKLDGITLDAIIVSIYELASEYDVEVEEVLSNQVFELSHKKLSETIVVGLIPINGKVGIEYADKEIKFPVDEIKISEKVGSALKEILDKYL